MKTDPSAPRSSDGFTLLETMMALLILGISLLGLAQLFGLAIYQNGYARNITMGITVARSKMEELKNLYNAELETGTPSTALTTGSHPAEVVTLQAPLDSNQANWDFLVSWTVTVSGNQKTVTVTVEPESMNQLQSKTVTLTSYFAP
ncbi:MAG: prepilin-type N-terminal cleavage/methylation domain-containing protein [Acidobacteria bacterium]|nr:prepilin-type N-terminal cleavage/methylation domain-containing protein [Acidobacteriota bacterium]